MKLIKLNIENEKYEIRKEVCKFLDPDYVYLPVSGMIDSLDGSKILKNEVISKNKLSSKSSSVSGTIVNCVNLDTSVGSVFSLKIRNNFKEKQVVIPKAKIADSDTFFALFKTDYLFDKLKSNKIKNIVINGIEDEPFNYSETCILKYASDDILEMSLFFNEIYSPDNNYISLKSVDSENINDFLNKIGSYPDANLVVLDDLYLIGRREFLLKKLNLPEKNTLILKPSEVLDIQNYIKNGVEKVEKYITVTIEPLKKVIIVYTKKYVLVSELLKHLEFNFEGCEYVKNGLMYGTKINPFTEIIDNDFSSLFILEKRDETEEECINCGKCLSVCPCGLFPKEFYKNSLEKEKCIKCGLCSYFCPSDIELVGGKHE